MARSRSQLQGTRRHRHKANRQWPVFVPGNGVVIAVMRVAVPKKWMPVSKTAALLILNDLQWHTKSTAKTPYERALGRDSDKGEMQTCQPSAGKCMTASSDF